MYAQYQCQSYSEQSGQVFIPNLPDLYYFSPENASRFRGDGGDVTGTGERVTTYIFTVPTLSVEHKCSGTVLSIKAQVIGQVRKVFDLLNLSSQFTVDETPREMCADLLGSVHMVCCTNGSLESGQFQFPASTFTIGVVTASSNFRLLTSVDGVTEYDKENFTESTEETLVLTLGDMLGGCNHSDHSLLLLQFWSKFNQLIIILNLAFLFYFFAVTCTNSVDPSTSSLRPGLIAGVVCGVLVACLLILVVVSRVALHRHHRKKQAVATTSTQPEAELLLPNHDGKSTDLDMQLPSPSRPGATLTQNPAYITTPDIPVKTNESYDGTTTTADHLYATASGEGPHMYTSDSEVYDYI